MGQSPHSLCLTSVAAKSSPAWQVNRHWGEFGVSHPDIQSDHCSLSFTWNKARFLTSKCLFMLERVSGQASFLKQALPKWGKQCLVSFSIIVHGEQRSYQNHYLSCTCICGVVYALVMVEVCVYICVSPSGRCLSISLLLCVLDRVSHWIWGSLDWLNLRLIQLVVHRVSGICETDRELLEQFGKVYPINIVLSGGEN